MAPEPTTLTLLEAVRSHLTAHHLPDDEMYSITLYPRGRPDYRVMVQLSEDGHRTSVARLLGWAATLSVGHLEVWRVPTGESVHLSVHGVLPGGITVRVFTDVPFTETTVGADLTPGASKTVSLTELYPGGESS